MERVSGVGAFVPVIKFSRGVSTFQFPCNVISCISLIQLRESWTKRAAGEETTYYYRHNMSPKRNVLFRISRNSEPHVILFLKRKHVSVVCGWVHAKGHLMFIKKYFFYTVHISNTPKPASLIHGFCFCEPRICLQPAACWPRPSVRPPAAWTPHVPSPIPRRPHAPHRGLLPAGRLRVRPPGRAVRPLR